MSVEPFVDREEEFALASRSIDRARAGQGGFLIVKGPAGIGKSAPAAPRSLGGRRGRAGTGDGRRDPS